MSSQTPFDDKGAVDLDSVESLADFYLKHGADGFTVLGVAGESVKLTADEAIQVVKRYLKRSQGRPVIVGVSNSSTAQLSSVQGADRQGDGPGRRGRDDRAAGWLES